MSVPDIMKGKFHPRDPLTEPRPRMPMPDGPLPAPTAGTANPPRRRMPERSHRGSS